MSTATASVSQPQSIASSADARIPLYAELAMYAVRLASTKIGTDYSYGRPTRIRCVYCQSIGEPGKALQHDGSCMIGRVFALTAEIGRLGAPDDAAAAEADETCPHCGPVCYRGAAHNARAEDGVFFHAADPAPERHIEYTPIAGRGIDALLGDAPATPGRRVTHEEAARAAMAVRA